MGVFYYLDEMFARGSGSPFCLSDWSRVILGLLPITEYQTNLNIKTRH